MTVSETVYLVMRIITKKNISSATNRNNLFIPVKTLWFTPRDENGNGTIGISKPSGL